MSLVERYNDLSSTQRWALSIAAFLAVVVLVAWMLWGSKTSRQADEAQTGELGRVAMTGDLLEDTLKERVESRVKELEEDNSATRDLLNEIVDKLNRQTAENDRKLRRLEDEAAQARRDDDAASENSANSTQNEAQLDLSPKNELAELGAYRVADSYPQPPQLVNPIPPPGLAPAQFETTEPRLLGAISVMPASGFIAPETKSEGDRIFLPPGFMNARLLTGVDALVSQNARGNPEPIIARVQAPAVLPNHVRANLQGCFVVGNATGSLAKERVEIRAVSLACIDFQERAVIDEPIKGFFVDTDGKKGLSGRVVTRSGALLARSFVAGVLSGFGQAVQATSGTRAISPLGEVRSFDAGEAAVAGLGGGVSQASEDLSELYLELARQAGPVVEVGAGKDVVLVIQEGVDLNIRRNVNVVQ